ncbi:MAG: AzlC family ABC transporter permease [Yoonia sp.]|uniref:AzlC family ABC transporter permease n=1 Tax=Yoonia sp. TaxID=2212373 RepID=UPI00326357F3
MLSATEKSAYLAGIRDGWPFVFVAAPFSMLFGVVAIEAGLSLSQAMGFSVVVIAGAAQFAAMQMMVDGASIALVLLAALAVNLRMAMYSASLVPWLGTAPLWRRAAVAYFLFDQCYMASMSEYESTPMSVSDRFWFFMGTATPLVPVWIMFTAIGALVGTSIPPEYALDFALPITFLAMIGPMMRTLAHVVAAFVSMCVGLALIWLPSGSGLLIAAGCAMVTGVIVESWMEKRT